MFLLFKSVNIFETKMYKRSSDPQFQTVFYCSSTNIHHFKIIGGHVVALLSLISRPFSTYENSAGNSSGGLVLTSGWRHFLNNKSRWGGYNAATDAKMKDNTKKLNC